ncbi:MAG: ParB N-terminal domain-containing protein [Deltaproteobacteria bacterium]
MNWLDHTRLLRLDPHEVDLENRTYYIPDFQALDGLVTSIENVGILNAPVLQEQAGGTLLPVLGRRRLQAARLIGCSQVEAEIVSAAMSESEGFLLAFWDNIGHRSLGSAGSAVVVRRLLELLPRETVARGFLPLLGIPPRGPRMERLRSIGGLEMPVLEALGTGRIMEKTAIILTDLNSKERAVLLDLVQRLGLNANKAAEVIEHLFDLSVLHGKGILEFLDEGEVSVILRNRDLPVPEQSARFRELVRAWRFPELTKKEQEFQSWRRRLPESERISIQPTPAFEDERCTVKITAESWGEAEKIAMAVGTAIR